MTRTDEIPRTWLGYVEQGEWWKPNGKPWIRIAEMDKAWRFNASRWLDRNAARFLNRATDSMMVFLAAELPGMSEMNAYIFENQLDRLLAATDDPAQWIRDTSLYRALVADLPTKRGKLERLAARAQHWSSCPVRTDQLATCRCAEIQHRQQVIADALAKTADQAGIEL